MQRVVLDCVRHKAPDGFAGLLHLDTATRTRLDKLIFQWLAKHYIYFIQPCSMCVATTITPCTNTISYIVTNLSIYEFTAATSRVTFCGMFFTAKRLKRDKFNNSPRRTKLSKLKNNGGCVEGMHTFIRFLFQSHFRIKS